MNVNATMLKLHSAACDLTVRELAAKSGVAYGTVCKARAGGKVSERVVLKLAKALGVEPQEIIRDSDQ